jgi:hypothetical protein
MKEAFNFMFKDNMLAKKALTYACAAFIANIISNIANTMAPAPNALPSLQYVVLFILGALFMLIPSGYGVSCIKAFVEQKENIVLPFLNVKNNFLLGFKLAVAVILMSLVFGLGITLLAIILAVIFSFLKMVNIGAIIIGLIAIVIFLVVSYYSLAFCRIFATTEKFSSFLQFKLGTQMIKTNFKHYTLSALLFCAIAIVTGIIGGLLYATIGAFGIVGLVVATLIVSLISGYTVYLFSYITAKSVKE